MEMQPKTDLGLPTREAEINYLTQLFCAYWIHHPEYRMGQAFSNLFGAGVHDVFFMQDQETLDAIAAELGLVKAEDVQE